MIIDKATFKMLLMAMYFIKGTGFTGEIWTNVDGPISQVWIAMDSTAVTNHYWRYCYDASADEIDWENFYNWFMTSHEQLEAEKHAETEMGDEW